MRLATVLWLAGLLVASPALAGERNKTRNETIPHAEKLRQAKGRLFGRGLSRGLLGRPLAQLHRRAEKTLDPKLMQALDQELRQMRDGGLDIAQHASNGRIVSNTARDHNAFVAINAGDKDFRVVRLLGETGFYRVERGAQGRSVKLLTAVDQATAGRLIGVSATQAKYLSYEVDGPAGQLAARGTFKLLDAEMNELDRATAEMRQVLELDAPAGLPAVVKVAHLLAGTPRGTLNWKRLSRARPRKIKKALRQRWANIEADILGRSEVLLENPQFRQEMELLLTVEVSNDHDRYLLDMSGGDASGRRARQRVLTRLASKLSREAPEEMLKALGTDTRRFLVELAHLEGDWEARERLLDAFPSLISHVGALGKGEALGQIWREGHLDVMADLVARTSLKHREIHTLIGEAMGPLKQRWEAAHADVQRLFDTLAAADPQWKKTYSNRTTEAKRKVVRAILISAAQTPRVFEKLSLETQQVIAEMLLLTRAAPGVLDALLARLPALQSHVEAFGARLAEERSVLRYAWDNVHRGAFGSVLNACE